MKKIFLSLLMGISACVSAMDKPPIVPKRNIVNGVLRSNARIEAQLLNLFGRTFTYIDLRKKGISDISRLGLDNEIVLIKREKIGNLEEVTNEDMNANRDSRMEFLKFEEANEDGKGVIYKVYTKNLDLMNLEHPLYLDLAHNNITEFNTNMPVDNIVIIDLSHNPLESIEFGKYLPNLEMLNVNHTHLSEVPYLEDFKNLRTLNIQQIVFEGSDEEKKSQQKEFAEKIKERFKVVKQEFEVGCIRSKYDDLGNKIATSSESSTLLYLSFTDIIDVKYRLIANRLLNLQSDVMYSCQNIIPSISRIEITPDSINYFCMLAKKGLCSLDGIDEWSFRINDRGQEKGIVTLKYLNNLSLYIADNNIVELPIAFYNLVGLTCLRLNDNQLSEITSNISNLVNLKELVLDNNDLTELPKELFELPSLRDLWVRDNQLIDLPPVTSEDVTESNLNRIVIDGNRVKNAKRLFEYLQKLSNLTHIECLKLNDRKEVIELGCPLEIDGRSLTAEEVQQQFNAITDSKKQKLILG